MEGAENMGWFFSNAHIRKAGGVSQEAVERRLPALVDTEDMLIIM